jgi:hypothetical protein
MPLHQHPEGAAIAATGLCYERGFVGTAFSHASPRIGSAAVGPYRRH